MKYEGVVYRPPSEANSIILQITIGCSHNKCSFCTMYKDKNFRIRDVNEILEELEKLSHQYSNTSKKFFLADGDALVLKTKDLEQIILAINKYFPESKISSYATAQDILRKSDEDLKYLNSIGLSLIYMGVESGSDPVLEKVCKGTTKQEMIDAGKKLKKNGFKQSIMIISGLGSEELLESHAKESAEVVNAIDPDYVSLLTLMVDPASKIYEEINSGKFKLLTPHQIMQETLTFIENLEVTNCIFRSNHASNYVSLAATLPYEKEELLQRIRNSIDSSDFKSESFRRL